MRFALIGQPNCGKSTLFNQVAGYKAETGNFSGTTVTYTESKVRVAGQVIDLVDLPGTYTLAGSNPAERESLLYLASHQVNVIVNVLDASHLSQGLSLTLELMEIGRPLVVVLNMMDEADRSGLCIDGLKLQELVSAPVVPMVASKGRGVRNLFLTAIEVARTGRISQRPCFAPNIEANINKLVACLDGQLAPLTPELVAIKLLEGNASILSKVREVVPSILPVLADAIESIQISIDQDPGWVIASERNRIAELLVGQVVRQGERRISYRDRLDDLLLHPFWGYVALIIILLVFFEVIYGLGRALELPLTALFLKLQLMIDVRIGTGTLFAELVDGVIQGIAGGVAIVLPYLVPFLLGLGFLEDIGYLPRVAFLMDALMHRIGLHGKAIVPFILGYGCNVPAVMSTRMLEDRRDRFLAAALATLVPCAARLAVVFGLVAFYLGPRLALGIYLFNLFVIALTGKVLTRLLPEDTPGMILEMPVYRVPTVRNVSYKAWFRVREFIWEAWPILILGSLFLAFAMYFDLTNFFNLLVRPFTWVLGLPGEVGVPLIFGILRKELSLIMLRQALGVIDISKALTTVQMVTFAVFVMFYIPCLATLAVLKRELGMRAMLWVCAITIVIATLAALAARGVTTLFY